MRLHVERESTAELTESLQRHSSPLVLSRRIVTTLEPALEPDKLDGLALARATLEPPRNLARGRDCQPIRDIRHDLDRPAALLRCSRG